MNITTHSSFMGGSGWGELQGVRTPKKSQNLGFHRNTGPDLLKSTRLPSQHSMLGHHRHASETPFKWRFAGGPMLARILWYLDPLSSQNLKNKIKRNKKKNVVKVGPPPAKLSGSAHEFHWPRHKKSLSGVHGHVSVKSVCSAIETS